MRDISSMTDAEREDYLEDILFYLMEGKNYLINNISIFRDVVEGDDPDVIDARYKTETRDDEYDLPDAEDDLENEDNFEASESVDWSMTAKEAKKLVDEYPEFFAVLVEEFKRIVDETDIPNYEEIANEAINVANNKTFNICFVSERTNVSCNDCASPESDDSNSGLENDPDYPFPVDRDCDKKNDPETENMIKSLLDDLDNDISPF